MSLIPPGPQHGAPPAQLLEKALQTPISVPFQTVDITPFNSNCYDAPQVTEGITTFPKHLH